MQRVLDRHRQVILEYDGGRARAAAAAVDRHEVRSGLDRRVEVLLDPPRRELDADRPALDQRPDLLDPRAQLRHRVDVGEARRRVRVLAGAHEVDFVRARSYGAATSSRGAVEITKDLETDVRGRHVIVVEDIADSGLTMRVVVERIAAGRLASLRRCALLVREGCPPEDEPDYAGLRVGPGFVVGYGIDYAERYRGLRDIRALPSAQRSQT